MSRSPRSSSRSTSLSKQIEALTASVAESEPPRRRVDVRAWTPRPASPVAPPPPPPRPVTPSARPTPSVPGSVHRLRLRLAPAPAPSPGVATLPPGSACRRPRHRDLRTCIRRRTSTSARGATLWPSPASGSSSGAIRITPWPATRSTGSERPSSGSPAARPTRGRPTGRRRRSSRPSRSSGRSWRTIRGARKAPAALYKEALTLIELKQPTVAQARLQYLVENFPQAAEASLARERLAALKDR